MALEVARTFWEKATILHPEYHRPADKPMLNRHFYRYEPPRPLDAIAKDIKTLEGEIVSLLKEVTA